MSWSTIDFPESIRKTAVGRENQILSADIQQSGRFPVVDQGQAFISGYSNEERRVIREDLPLVIFGDHTRCVKYVDFPFILGADGTKVLKPKEEIFDARFFYYALLSLEIPNRGYNRHFTLLKEQQLPKPEKQEQRKIAVVLRLVQLVMEQQERLLALTTELKEALSHKLFTEGLRGEPQKDTEFGFVPKSWRLQSIDELDLDIGDGNYSTKYPKRDEFLTTGIPFVRANNLDDGRLIWDEMRYISPELHATLKKGHLKKNDVCLVTRGSIGDVAFVTDDFVGANMNAQLVRLNGGEGIDGKFLYYALSHPASQKQLKSLTTGTALQQLPIGKLKFVRLPIPSKAEQVEIANALWLTDLRRDIINRKCRALAALFKTLLHQLMTAQIRVNDLDLESAEACETTVQ
jgi:type I restriction enzyme S subunit